MNVSRPIRISFCLLATLAGGFISQARAQEVVVNGGFDDDPNSFAPWVVNDPDDFTFVGNDTLFSISLPNHADLGASPDVGSLSQTLNTVAGTTYSLSFWVQNNGGADPGSGVFNSFAVQWDGNVILSLVNSPVFNYTQYTFSETASSSSTVLEFDYRNDEDFWRLDSVSAVGPVPEPSVTWLGLTALVGAGGMALRRRLS